MRVRPITRDDIPGVVDCGAAAFATDALTRWTFPHMAEHQESWRDMSYRRARLRFVTPGTHGFVCMADDDDTPHQSASTVDTEPRGGHKSHAGEVMGYVYYERHGVSSSPARTVWLQNNRSFFYALERLLYGIEERYKKLLRLDLAADHRNVALFDDYLSTSRDPFEPCPENWYVGVLVTHPRWQRRGVGSRLLEWGFARSGEDGIPLCLIASAPGQRLYEKLGFKVLSWGDFSAWEDRDDSGAMCAWDPTEEWVRPANGDETIFIRPSDGKRLPVTGKWTDQALQSLGRRAEGQQEKT